MLDVDRLDFRIAIWSEICNYFPDSIALPHDGRASFLD